MLFSYNWLKEYLEGAPPARELAERLTMTGTEIESVTEIGAGFTNVVTAQVLECEKHPNADKLSLCKVRTDKEELSIVCGAKNMKPGDKVALALPGAELPGGFKIKKSKIRGVESQGMMCSEVELGLKDTSEGIMILPEDAPLGVDFRTILGADFMMEAGITPNRADLLSIRGMAREAAAVTGAAFKDKEFKVDEAGRPIGECASVSIEKDAPCRRYAARVVEGVQIGPSPDDIKARLEAHGVRSINNVVDVTNLVLLETGQPLHAFDLDKLNGAVINVRPAREGETIETIDGKTRNLDASMLVIADSKGPVALAGVMGGSGSEVTGSTKRILIESAWFEPSSVRRASRKHALSTESSYRFERGVDIEGVTRALDMAASLVLKLAGGQAAKGSIDIYPGKYAPAGITFRTERASRILGVGVRTEEALNILGRLGISARETSPGVISAAPPSYRMDLTTEIDLMEEVARIFGYNNIPTTLPIAAVSPGETGEPTALRRSIRSLLSGSGFTEVMNYSFISRDLFAMAGGEAVKGVELLNPLTEEQTVMRTGLIPSLLENMARNLAWKREDLRIFEIAPAFVPGDGLPGETWKIAGLLYGNRYEPGWSYPKDTVDFFDVKGVIERMLEGLGVEGARFEAAGHPLLHPGKTAALKISGKHAGILGELHPDLWGRYGLRKPAYVFELEIEPIEKSSGKGKKYRELPRFPESARDIAFILSEDVPFGDIYEAIRKIDLKTIETVELFDVYYGRNIPSGTRSLAVRVTYRSRERTLTDQEVEDTHGKVLKMLSERFKAEIRVS
ncbi:MAG: phenylalanine--tRNA ligase subunit beta [Deltaproteobacteria bacterium]|nr:phenylalanine--tRNA ligase subunit beta [Deltaproteobacteria bacterium]MBZ0219822.1 phenylalanine--tRNA ligase subunit beta [Deltaproteobacteria bacterium]